MAQATAALRSPWVPGRPLAIVAALGAVGAGAAAFWSASVEIGVYWLIGLAVGVILQRTRLCFAGAFRDTILLHDTRILRAVLLALAVSTAGFWLFMLRTVPDPSFGALPPGAHIMPVGLHLVVGGLVFGLGMVLAGGCVSGSLFRVGEGYVASGIAIIGILAGLAVAAATWNWWWTAHIQFAPLVWLPGSLGYGGALALTIGLLALAIVAAHWWESRGGGVAPSFPAGFSMPPSTLRERASAAWQTVFGAGWPYTVGAVALAVVNVFAFVFAHPVGVTGELATWSQRILGIFGLGSGPLLGVDRFAGCNLTVGDASLVTSAFTLNLGLIAGSFVAALASNEFKVRLPRTPGRAAQALGGGVLMGYGAGIAVGCTLGAFFSAVPSLSLSGWVFGLSLLGGAWLGTLAIRRLG